MTKEWLAPPNGRAASHAVALLGAAVFVSYTDAANLRSARLARQLGARRDAAAEALMAARGETDLHVYRHSGTGMPA
jgi:hypothetical protein